LHVLLSSEESNNNFSLKFTAGMGRRNPLLDLVETGQLEEAERRAEMHPEEVNMQTGLGYCPVLLAISHNNMPMLKMLVEAGCELNVQDAFGHGTMRYAGKNGYREIEAYLYQQAWLLQRSTPQTKIN
jgi:hypothetical protein